MALVTACGPDTGTDSADTPQGVCPQKDGDIRLAAGADLSSTGVRGRLVAQWNALCPESQAQLVELPADADLQRSQLVAAQQTRKATYDVLALDVTWTAEFAEGGLIRRYPQKLDDDFLAPTRETVTVDREVWGVPFNTDAGLLYYRKDILKAAGAVQSPPKNRRELVDAMDAIARSGYPDRHKEYQAAYITQLKPYEGLTVNAMEAIWNAGGDLVDGDGKVVEDSDSISGATAGLKVLAGDYDRYMPTSADAADETTSQQAFASGAVVFMRNWPYAYNVLAKKLVPGRDFDVTTLPSTTGGPGISVLGGQNLAISAHTGEPEAAHALIDFLTSRESERCLLEGGFAATRSSAYDTDPSAPRCTLPAATPAATTTPGPDAEQAGPTTSAGQLPAYAEKLRAAVLAARSRPVTPYYAAFTGLVQSRVGELLHPRTSDDPNPVGDLLDNLGPALLGRDRPETTAPSPDGSGPSGS